MRFQDRQHAATQLVDALRAYKGQHPLVLAVPKGGVVLGKTIAEQLDGDLDVVLVRKLRLKEHQEFAIGAIDEEGRVMLHPSVKDIDKKYLEGEIEYQMQLIEASRQAFTEWQQPISARGRTVIIVDDGMATGFTMLAAIHFVRQQRPRKIVVATAVAPGETIDMLKKDADEVICLQIPTSLSFNAVGQFFVDFTEVTEKTVSDLLKAKNQQFA